MPASFLILLACLLVAAKVFGWCAQKLGMPPVLGQLVAGVLVGPSFLGWVQPSLLTDTFSNIGVIILMFIAGLETDAQQMRRVGRVAFISASMGVVLPFAAGTVFALASHYPLPASLFLGTLLTATSVSISAQTLKDLGKLTSKEGTTILGAAVIDDVLGLLVLSAILAFTLGENPVWSLLKMVLYFPIAFLLGRYLFPLLSHWLPRLLAVEVRLGFVLALVFFYAWSAESLGNVAAITGAYIAGVLMSSTDMREWVHDGMSKLGYALFIPLFFIGIGIQATFQGIWDNPALVGFSLSLIGIGIVTKVVGCGGGALLGKFTPDEALKVGVGMISRGEVALISATIGLQAGLVTPALFSATVLLTIITTLVTPPLFKLVYRVRPALVAYPLPEANEDEFAIGDAGEQLASA
jgi:Kef-type K+ transport system membrane component KefB